MTDRSFLEKGKESIILLITSADFRTLISELGQTVAKIFSKEETKEISKESVQKDHVDTVALRNQDIILRFLNLMDQISQDKDHYKALDFFISCVRKSEREMKEIVKFGPEASSDASDSHISHAKKELEVRIMILKTEYS